MEKTCAKCSTVKPLSEFNKNRARKDGLQPSCRDCCKKQTRSHYERNKDYYKAKSQAARIPAQRRLFDLLFEYLGNNPCVDCGESDIMVLQFDHQRDKVSSVCSMVMQRSSWESIQEEIAKCEVRCANCHMRRTAKQFNWYRHQVHGDSSPC